MSEGVWVAVIGGVATIVAAVVAANPTALARFCQFCIRVFRVGRSNGNVNGRTDEPPPPPPPPEIINSIGMKLKLIPAGTFVMGSPEDEEGRSPEEGPRHEVTISRPFYLGVYPVTQREYEIVMRENPSCFGGKPDHPVEKIRWMDAVKCCAWMSALPGEVKAGRVYRLPTEAEWEYACRAGTTTSFHFGSSASSTQANFNGKGPYGGAPAGPKLGCTTKVGSYPANTWGLYDMHGNVWEWCEDWFAADYYNKSDTNDPKGSPSGPMRVSRGGCWWEGGAECRAARRGAPSPGSRNMTYGFRVACSVAAGTS